MTKEQELRLRMISYDGGDPARIQHFIKVYTFAVMIGEGEQLPEETMEILRAAALVHDIGIKGAVTESSKKRKDRRWPGRC